MYMLTEANKYVSYLLPGGHTTASLRSWAPVATYHTLILHPPYARCCAVLLGILPTYKYGAHTCMCMVLDAARLTGEVPFHSAPMFSF